MFGADDGDLLDGSQHDTYSLEERLLTRAATDAWSLINAVPLGNSYLGS